MTGLLRRIISRHDETTRKSNVKRIAVFHLSYGPDKLDVGRLVFNDGEWTFEYTDDFRRQSEVKPMIGFSDVNRVYVSDELWPFFTLRIPSLQQPAAKKAVQEAVERGEIQKEHATDDVELLGFFGKRSVANSFELEVANGT